MRITYFSEMFPGIITILFILAVIIQGIYLIYFTFCFVGISETSKNIGGIPAIPVSIIICARNEAKNLQKNLHKVLQQDYIDISRKSLFEVVLVNDHSDDDTARILGQLQKEYPHLVVVHLKHDEPGGKKKALSKAVNEAQYKHLLFTDADCIPASDKWITCMTQPFTDGKEIVAAYAGYLPADSFLNKFTRCETVHTFMQYLSYNKAHLPYMTTGRNMACTKDVFIKAQAHPLYHSLPYGDDDLLVNICATGSNMEVLTNPQSFTYTDTKNTWAEWVEQKKRHLSTGKYYKPLAKLLLGFYAFTHFLSWTLYFLLLYILPASAVPDINLLMAGRIIFYQTAAITACSYLQERKLWGMFFLFDIGWVFYNLFFAPYIFLKNKQAWK